MKPVDIESPIGLDRLATWNEVRCAMSFSFYGAIELVSACDDFREIDSEVDSCACNLPEDKMWSAIISEVLDSKIN